MAVEHFQSLNQIDVLHRRQQNYRPCALFSFGCSIISGGENTGKSEIVKQIMRTLKAPPFYCYSDVFYCARNKGRKVINITKYFLWFCVVSQTVSFQY